MFLVRRSMRCPRRTRVRRVRGLRLGAALAVVVLAVVGAARADQFDPQLERLFGELRDAPDVASAQSVEHQIWHRWLHSGRAEVDREMRAGIAAMAAGRLQRAASAFAGATEIEPRFAEAWNKLATVHYLRGAFADSMAAIRRTLALEPRHFGALSGMALIFLDRGDEQGALRAFERVLTIHPYAAGAREQVRRLRARSGGRVI